MASAKVLRWYLWVWRVKHHKALGWIDYCFQKTQVVVKAGLKVSAKVLPSVSVGCSRRGDIVSIDNEDLQQSTVCLKGGTA